MPYEVPPLPYDYDALEEHVDEATMRVHHDKHHQAYVDKVNAALEGTDWADRPIEDVIANLSQIPDDKRTAVRNNGGGHYNHSLFWEWMSPDGGGEPDGDLATAIESAFGSFSDFQGKFKDAGVNQFGSGWSWLVHDGSGLAVVSTANQDNPLTDGKTPLLGARTTSTPGGTSSTGRRWRRASAPRAASRRAPGRGAGASRRGRAPRRAGSRAGLPDASRRPACPPARSSCS
jgi:superoxide dismutase, Fe-Mn family